MINLRERPFAKFGLCFIISSAICLIFILFLYKGMDKRAFLPEFPVLAMLCVCLSLAITLFDVFQAAMLALLLIGEYVALSFFSGRMAGDWELRVFDQAVLQVSLKQTHMLLSAAILTAAVAFILCMTIVKLMSRRENKEPQILQEVSYADMTPRLPLLSSSEVTLSQEEIEFLLGKNEQMAAKK
jgi:hypothetical protein